MLKQKKFNVILELTNQQLGTISKSKEIYTKFIASKNPDKVTPEIAAMEAEDIVEDLDNTGWTCFMQDSKGLYILNYMILGFLKDAGFTLKEQLEPGEASKKSKSKSTDNFKQVKSKIENTVFVTTRKIHFQRDGKFITEPDGVLERPLRAMTMQGPRVALAKSDFIDEGAQLNFELVILDGKEIKESHVAEILSFGELRGLGQFRNGSYGTFKVIKFEEIK